MVGLYRWVKNATRCSRQQPGITIVCDQRFRVEQFTLHDPNTPVLGPSPEAWPGHHIQDHIPRFLMHLVANAAQRAVGTPYPVDTQYPIKINGAWYRSSAQITADPVLKLFTIKIKREPLVIGYQEPAKSVWAG